MTIALGKWEWCGLKIECSACVMNQKVEREEIGSYIFFYPSLDCVLNSQHKSPALKFTVKFRAC